MLSLWKPEIKRMAKKYKPVGVCIYCGSKEKLTDEHIIPLGLNGEIVLPKASCPKCNAVTSSFEQSVLRGNIRHVRAALGFPTRRPKDMPKTFPLLITVNGQESTIQVPAAESLVVLPFPLFGLPGFIAGIAPKAGIGINGFVNVHFGADPQILMARYGAEKVGMVLRVDSIAFARMLAKIAYCTVVGELGYDALSENFVLAAIRGESNDLGTWVGSGGDATPPTMLNVQHSAIYSIYEKEGQRVLTVFIKLFSNSPAPAYAIVLGRPAPGLTIRSATNATAL
jgi:hypothetical protein